MSDCRPSSPPLALSDEQMEILSHYARPLLPAARGRFLERVARLLEGESEIDDGSLWRACKTAQRELLARQEAPAIDGTAG
jgi:hypothetical protein